MKIIKFGSEQKINTPINLCLGYFESLHKGHLDLILRAKNNNIPLCMLTFIHNPLNFFQKKINKEIFTFEERTKLLLKIGVKHILLIDFDKTIRNLSIDEFHEIIKYHFPNLQKIYCGEDFKYAKKALGNIKTLVKNFNVDIVKTLKINSQKMSTTIIKNELICNNFDFVNKNLYFNYFFSGDIFSRNGYGQKMGFPTINLKISKYKLIPQEGVYICKLIANDIEYYGLLSIGHNPTVNYSKKLSIEIHILYFIVPKILTFVTVFPIKWIRNTIKFKSVGDLKQAINNDMMFALNFIKICKNKKNILK